MPVVSKSVLLNERGGIEWNSEELTKNEMLIIFVFYSNDLS